MMTVYGDITPRTAAYVVVELLKRAMPYLVLEKFGQAKSLPANNTQSMKFRRYNAIATTGTRLTEGVTPAGKKLTTTDITAQLYQDGDYVEITDIIADTHEDAVQHESMSIVAEQAAKVVEINRYNVLKACTNVFYANSVAGRTSVVAVISRTDQRKIVRALERQEAQHITQIVKSTPSFNQESILPAFVGVTHTDLTTDIRSMTGFTGCQDYGSMPKWETEIGACEDVRYLKSTIFTPYEDGGSATTTGKITTAGVGCDVYPVMYFGRDAYGIIALKGKYAITPMVLNPNTPRGGDPLGQRGSIGWKTMQGTVILNDSWCAVYEAACTD
ncbi:MAG: N4-gp56 family major capsid protein [Methanoregula sp.]|jgi:N4-gp56 family major capsid protein